MTAELRSYPEYKDSKVFWLGKMPSHWEIDPGLAVFSDKKLKNTGLKEKTVLSLSYGKIVVKPPEKLHGLVPESFETYQIVNPGNIIIRSTDLQNDWNSLRVGLVENQGIITSAYICLKTKDRMLPEYGHLLLHSYDLMKIFYGMGSGLRQNLDWSDFKRLPVLIPPINEQKTIVNYIKITNNKISRFIQSKRRLIEVLNERKQAIINRAVTRGLDSKVSLKPSGIDWFGNIPEHWKVKPLKRWVSINQSVLPESTDSDYTFDYPEIGCVGTGMLVDKPSRIRFGDAPSRARRILQIGDTIISTVHTYLRAVYFVSEKADDLVASTGFAVLTPDSGIVPEFLGITLQSDPFIDHVAANSIGIAYPAISETRLGSFQIALPPSVEEQTRIVAEVRRETQDLMEGIDHAQREIDLIREYRTRLITNVVTGKLNVLGKDFRTCPTMIC